MFSEPVCVSQRSDPSCPEPPTFDDFVSTPCLQADLMSFKPSQLMSQPQRRVAQPEDEALSDVLEGNVFRQGSP